MERIKIDVYISDLLYSYDCVIVPEFGGFVTNYASAQIQKNQHKFNPPSKNISFNKNLKNNDGLLINHIAERRSIEYEEASDLIRAFVNQSIEGLRQGDKINIEKVGTLYLDADQNVRFKAVEKNDYLLDSFGLTSFRAMPIKRQTVEEKIEQKVKDKIPSKVKAKRPFYWSAAAVVLVLFGTTFFLNSQYNWVNTTKLEYALLSYPDKSESTYVLSDKLTPILSTDLFYSSDVNFAKGIAPFRASDGALMAFYVDNRELDRKAEVDNTKVAESTLNKELKFHVMGGCFENYSNATSLVSSLQKKGFASRLLGRHKNLHAVSYASFASREEAEKMLATVRNSENSAAWILVKPF